MTTVEMTEAELKAIEARHRDMSHADWSESLDDVPALIAEVRRCWELLDQYAANW